MVSLSNEKKVKYIGQFFLLLIALIILFASIVLTGLELLAKNKKIDDLRKIPIEYVKKIDNGEKICKIYKVPNSNVGPEDKKYILKEIRDNLWVNLSKDAKTKSEIHLLIADKKILEAFQLIKNKKDEKTIMKIINESIFNLKEAKRILAEVEESPETLNINKKIIEAGLAYEDIVKFLNYKSEKMEIIVDDLEKWNKGNN